MALDADGRRLLVTSGSIRSPIYQVNSISMFPAYFLLEIILKNLALRLNIPGLFGAHIHTELSIVYLTISFIS